MNKLTQQTLTDYCLSKPGTTASYPFGEGTLVLKVLDKMFALISEDSKPLRINLKCDPEDALALRKQYTAITPGYHMNKKHWNTLEMNGSLPPHIGARIDRPLLQLGRCGNEPGQTKETGGH